MWSCVWVRTGFFWKKLCMVKNGQNGLEKGVFNFSTCYQFLLNMFLNKEIVFNIFLCKPHVFRNSSSRALGQTTLNQSDCRILWRNISRVSDWISLFLEPPFLSEKGSYDFTTVSMSVCQ